MFVKNHATVYIGKTHAWVVVSIQLKNIGETGSSPQVGYEIKKRLKPRFTFYRFTLPETNSSHLKMDAWNTTFLLGPGLFSSIFRCEKLLVSGSYTPMPSMPAPRTREALEASHRSRRFASPPPAPYHGLAP